MKLLINMKRQSVWLVAVAVIAIAAPMTLSALEPEEGKSDSKPQTSFSVDDLKWMTGTWHGEIFGGPIVERWHAPLGGAMLGTSHMGNDRAKSMYELLLIEEKDGAPTMFLRHFKQFLTTKEDAPMEFRLTNLKGKKAVFETSDKSHGFTKISYELEGREMLVILEGEGSGKPMKVESRMTKMTGRKK
jgi:hypothetical protein